MRRLHLLRPGEFTDARGTKVSLSESDIGDIATGYDPSRHEAPLVVGHPRSDKPAFGWIDKLEAGSRGLFGTPKQVAPEFSEAVQKGSYKKISASLYGPDNPRNTNPGKWSLRHVGFLGAQPPAVSGLQDVQFAEDDEADLVIEADFADAVSPWIWSSLSRVLRGVRDWIIDEHDLETADRVMPSWELDHIEQAEAESKGSTDNERDAYMSDDNRNNPPADLAEREQAAATREAELAERERKLNERESARRQRAAVEFAENLASEGRILPREQKAVSGILTLLDQVDENTVEFAEEGEDASAATSQVPAAKAFRSILSGLSKRVDFSERSGGLPPNPSPGTGQFNAPRDYDVDQNSLTTHKKVMDLCERENIGYDEALTRVINSGS